MNDFITERNMMNDMWYEQQDADIEVYMFLKSLAYDAGLR